MHNRDYLEQLKIFPRTNETPLPRFELAAAALLRRPDARQLRDSWIAKGIRLVINALNGIDNRPPQYRRATLDSPPFRGIESARHLRQ